MKRFLLQFAVLLLLAASAAAADYPTVAISDTVWPEGDGATEGYVTFTLSEPYAYDIGTSTRLYTPPRLNEYWANIRFETSTCLIPAGQTSCQAKLLIDGNNSYQSLTKEWLATSQYLIQGGPGGFLPTSGANFTITLTEDDPVPSVTLADATVTEPENGIYWFGMTFEASAPVTGTVAWRLIDETATHSIDYWEAFANPDFPDSSSPFQFRNRQQASIGFAITSDNLDEPDESFVIELYNPFDLTLERTLVRVTIVDSDTAVPFISAQAGDVTEGDSGSTNVTITFTASEPVTGSFSWVTDNGSANAQAGDYQAGSGTVHFTGGTTATLDIPVYGDLEDELEEAFYVRLYDPVGLQFAGNNNSVQVWIHDDDDVPAPLLVFVPADGLMLYSGQSATVEAYLTSNGVQALEVPLQVVGDAIEIPSSVFIPSGGSGELTITALSPGGATIACNGSIHCEPLPVQVMAQEIDGLAPRMVSTAGGTNVTLHGLGFSEGCSVTFGGVPAASSFVAGLQTIHAVTPPHAAGTVDVTVTCGAAAVNSPDRVEYVVPRRRAVGR
jgi:hypothetical protein